MRLATYNMRKAVGLDRRRDAGRVMDVINAIHADVVVLQEADLRLGARPAALPRHMIDTHSDFEPVHLGRNAVSLGFHGNAILVRRGFEVANIRQIELPGLEPRGAVAVDISDGDKMLRVVGVHLGLMRRYRRAQIAAIMASVMEPDVPLAVLGDFNEWSPRLGLEGFTGALTVHAPGRSFHAARPMAALDRVALSDHVTLTDGGVEQHKTARIASDHLPVWVDVSL